MEYINHSPAVLEFDKVLARLADCAVTEGAKARCLSLTMSDDTGEIRRRLARTSAAKELSGIKGMPSFGTVKDVRGAVERAEKGAVLSTRELLDIAALLRSARSLNDYKNGGRTIETALDEIFDRLLLNRPLEEKITRAILAEDLIADEASPELATIRRKMRAEQGRVKEILQRYTSSSSKYLQENIVTTRGGRYVVPVKAEYRNEVKGLVHDTSASGSTLFIEPMAVVEANNALRELEAEEKHEIERILSALSAEAADFGNAISLDYMNITELSFIFACGDLSYKMNATCPEITEKREMALLKARHPLLDKNKVVPITVTLGGDTQMLVITGPNTGGKTVSLKTIGLFAMMTQAGLHIPVTDGSKICVFDQIFSDIGDEQSIEQSLSTFSSHMKEIVSILDRMTENSLVLFDELGAGTDPVEGAALAVSILQEVLGCGALCAATTHYAELKAFAIEQNLVANASCEFDVETLRPTYRLIIGAPGKSNAFAISERLGLPKSVIDRARGSVDEESRNFEYVISKLENTRRLLDKELAEAEKNRREYEAFRQNAEAELRRKIGTAEKDAERMKTKAQEILDGAKVTSQYVMSQLEDARRELESEKAAEKLSEKKRAIRDRINRYDDEINPDADDDENYTLPRPLVRGDRVQHRNLGQKGVVLDEPDRKNMLNVQFGNVRMKVSSGDLRLLESAAEAEAEKKKQAERSLRVSVAKAFKPELDIRGQTGDDGWFMVDKYLDEAKIAQIRSVTIIHGKGTGALRQAIWNDLKKDPRVVSFRPGQYGEGDYGVTVVELKP